MKTKLQIIQEADKMFFEAASERKRSDSITDHDAIDLSNMTNKNKTPTEENFTINSTDEKYNK